MLTTWTSSAALLVGNCEILHQFRCVDLTISWKSAATHFIALRTATHTRKVIQNNPTSYFGHWMHNQSTKHERRTVSPLTVDIQSRCSHCPSANLESPSKSEYDFWATTLTLQDQEPVCIVDGDWTTWSVWTFQVTDLHKWQVRWLWNSIDTEDVEIIRRVEFPFASSYLSIHMRVYTLVATMDMCS